jgi:ubiquitin C-terminal hydrolase
LKAPFDVKTPFETPFKPTEIDDHGDKVPVAFKILKPPSVLVYQFVRFIPILDDHAQKINDPLVNMQDQIDLSHVIANGQRAYYDLFAIIEHQGLVSHHGHYVAYINLGLRNRWYLFDDWTVEPATDKDFQRALKQSYITFWIRQDRDAREAVGF